MAEWHEVAVLSLSVFKLVTAKAHVGSAGALAFFF